MNPDSHRQGFVPVHPYESEEELTHREEEVLNWVLKGKTNEEIGVILNISSRTVSKHLEHIFAKYHVPSRIHAVVHYLEKVNQKPGPL